MKVRQGQQHRAAEEHEPARGRRRGEQDGADDDVADDGAREPARHVEEAADPHHVVGEDRDHLTRGDGAGQRGAGALDAAAR